jgi:antitoxin ParD1/3/4
MNVSLTKELEKFIQRKVASGRYTSASEVVREALRLLEQQEKLDELRAEELRQKLEEGWRAAEQGELVDGPGAMNDLVTKIQRSAKAKKKSA